MSHQMPFDIDEMVVFEIEGTAEWRRGKAEVFPNDLRNQTAAEELELLADQVRGQQGSELHRQIDQLFGLLHEVDGSFFDELSQSVAFELRRVGFHVHHDGLAFLSWYKENLETLLRNNINGGNAGVAAPDLEEQVDKDPAVKAAKQIYDDARANAYARARKLL